jgi:hypothetical protein
MGSTSSFQPDRARLGLGAADRPNPNVVTNHIHLSLRDEFGVRIRTPMSAERLGMEVVLADVRFRRASASATATYPALTRRRGSAHRPDRSSGDSCNQTVPTLTTETRS